MTKFSKILRTRVLAVQAAGAKRNRKLIQRALTPTILENLLKNVLECVDKNEKRDVILLCGHSFCNDVVRGAWIDGTDITDGRAVHKVWKKITADENFWGDYIVPELEHHFGNKVIFDNIGTTFTMDLSRMKNSSASDDEEEEEQNEEVEEQDEEKAAATVVEEQDEDDSHE